MMNYGRGIVTSVGWSEDRSVFRAVIEFRCEADIPELPFSVIWQATPVQIIPIPPDPAGAAR